MTDLATDLITEWEAQLKTQSAAEMTPKGPSLEVRVANLIRHPVAFVKSEKRVGRIHLVSYAKLEYADPKMLVSTFNLGLDTQLTRFFLHIHSWDTPNESSGGYSWFNDHIWWRTALKLAWPLIARVKRPSALTRQERVFIHHHVTTAVAMPQKYR